MILRWQEYVVTRGGAAEPAEAIWREASTASGGQRSMYMLGVGFDPRALVGLQQFLSMRHATPPVVGLIELPPPSPASGLSARALAGDNQDAFLELTRDVEVRTVSHEEVHARSNAGPRVARAATKSDFVADIGHLVVDISSLPSNLYFPVIAAVLTSVDRRVIDFPSEIQVVACENPAIDAAIEELGVTEARAIGGFRRDLEHESEPNGTIIWAPVVGEGAGAALSAVHSFLGPDDVFPILPFPSRHPRRADNLLLEHQVELLDTFQIVPANIIYADERNPFDLYRTLSRLHEKFRLALAELDSSTLVLSTHSSKLLSLGVLLAAYEHELPIVSAPPIDYELDSVDLTGLASSNELVCAWLAGFPYADLAPCSQTPEQENASHGSDAQWIGD